MHTYINNTATSAWEQGCTFSQTCTHSLTVSHHANKSGGNLTVKVRWIAVDSQQETRNCWLFLWFSGGGGFMVHCRMAGKVECRSESACVVGWQIGKKVIDSQLISTTDIALKDTLKAFQERWSDKVLYFHPFGPDFLSTCLICLSLSLLFPMFPRSMNQTGWFPLSFFLCRSTL